MERTILRGLLYVVLAWSCLIYVSTAITEGRNETAVGFTAVIMLAALAISAAPPVVASEPPAKPASVVAERSRR